MEELYDLMPERFTNTLKLIKKFDEKLYNRASKTIFGLPNAVLNKVKEQREFECTGIDFKTFY